MHGIHHSLSSLGVANPLRHWFLSPHYDDVTLSCGATVALLARSGHVPETLVLFGGEPDPDVPLPPLAIALHQSWGLRLEEVVATRQREESAAANVLGNAWQALPFLDAIYRHPHYRTGTRLFSQPVATEANFPAQLALAVVNAIPPATPVRLYAPLAIGGHVDHRHAFAAGVILSRAGWDVWFYEDLPYALCPGGLEQRLTQLTRQQSPVPTAIAAVELAWDAKIVAILAYSSQLTNIFRRVGATAQRDQIDRVLQAYALTVGGGRLAERFWRLEQDDV